MIGFALYVQHGFDLIWLNHVKQLLDIGIQDPQG